MARGLEVELLPEASPFASDEAAAEPPAVLSAAVAERVARGHGPAAAAGRYPTPERMPVPQGGEPAVAGGSAPEAGVAEPPAGSASHEPPRLSLAQLGVGAPGSLLPLDSPEPSSVARAEQRLNDSLSVALAREDSARGVGIEGPALRAVTELVMDAALPLSTQARLLLVVDGRGAIESVSLLEVGADRSEWQRVADALHRRLRARTLRVPAGSAGARLELDVASRPLTLSGGRPGLDAEAFGRAAPAPGTPAAGRVSVLPRQAAPARSQYPWLEIGSHPQPMAGFSTNVGTASGDLADVGGSLRRSVSARLASLTLVPSAAVPSSGAPVGTP